MTDSSGSATRDTAARVCTEGDFYGDDPDEVFALFSCDLERGHDGLHRDLARGIEWRRIRTDPAIP